MPKSISPDDTLPDMEIPKQMEGLHYNPSNSVVVTQTIVVRDKPADDVESLVLFYLFEGKVNEAYRLARKSGRINLTQDVCIYAGNTDIAEKLEAHREAKFLALNGHLKDAALTYLEAGFGDVTFKALDAVEAFNDGLEVAIETNKPEWVRYFAKKSGNFKPAIDYARSRNLDGTLLDLLTSARAYYEQQKDASMVAKIDTITKKKYTREEVEIFARK